MPVTRSYGNAFEVVDYTQEEEVSLNGSNMLVGMEQEVGLILSAIHMGV